VILCLPFCNCLHDDPLAPYSTVIVNLMCTLNALYIRVYARSHSQNVTVATGTCQCSVVLSPRPIRQHCTFTITPPTVPLYHRSCTPVQLFTSVQTGRQASIPTPWNVSLRRFLAYFKSQDTFLDQVILNAIFRTYVQQHILRIIPTITCTLH